MRSSRHSHAAHQNPIDVVSLQDGTCVLAVIIDVEGPSYRPLGATMVIFEDGKRVGALSSGCIEKDVALHALETLASGKPKKIRYGRGSEFADLKLPCGGGLGILLLPRPDRSVLNRIAQNRTARIPCTLCINLTTGILSFASHGETGQDNEVFRVRFLPEIRFLVFGKGPEAGAFSTLVHSAGYPNILLSPDDETLASAASIGCETRHLTAPAFPADVDVDPYTAIILFFHDHEWEPPILFAAASYPAFYIGAQGSKLSRVTRDLKLEAMGLDQEAIHRQHGPIGLVPSARDARTLAISVLAEVLAVATNAILQGPDQK